MDRRSMVTAAVALAMVIVLALPLGAVAKGRPTTEATNSLSVPTIMAGGGGFTGVSCGIETPSTLAAPTGTPLTGYPIDPAAYYYVQGVNKWQAQCYTTATEVASVTAEWGDNLTGDARLKVGSPIRVELGLFNSTGAAMDGYTVVKLDPNALDRESPYGTPATADGLGGFFATPTAFTKVRVFDDTVTFSIRNADTGTYVVQPGTDASAEINSTGNVVYGYNLRVTQAGNYEITYITPLVSLIGTDGGSFETHSVTLLITVGGGGGGGGGGHGGGGGGH
jgi:hypothetical protein